jgi:hypothetical protein
VPDDLVDSLRTFLLGGVVNSVANPVAKQPEDVANSVANKQGSVAESVAEQRLRAAKLKAAQQLVLKAEELREQSLSWREIAQRWNAEGVATLSGTGRWHDGNIARLVRRMRSA